MGGGLIFYIYIFQLLEEFWIIYCGKADMDLFLNLKTVNHKQAYMPGKFSFIFFQRFITI